MRKQNRSWRAPCVSFVALILSGCTTLGPMPATTGLASVPAERPDVEVAIGAVPGYYLSSSVKEAPEGTPIQDASMLLEPDRLLGVRGLVVGARAIGNEGSGVYGEPLLGYKTFLEDGFSLGVFAFGTHASDEELSASYSATRIGGEGSVDYRVGAENRWLEFHVSTGASLVGLDAAGTYCLDLDNAFGMDCENPPMRLTHASAGGLYPSLFAGLSFEALRHRESVFHGLRLGAQLAVGTMPHVVSALQVDAEPYYAVGVMLSAALGASDAPSLE